MKIFATDPAAHNLTAARKGTYPASLVERLPAERLKRFFDHEGDHYRVKHDIREMVLFAPQNLLTDPPYSKMDLVSCRNLLIYLEADAQERVLALAHFALRDGGFLFLGNAENIGSREHLFEPVSKRWRIYRRIGPARISTIDFTSWASREAAAVPPHDAPKLADMAIRTLADRFAPTSVVIDRHHHILHFHGRTGDWLAQPSGEPTLDLLSLARDGFRLPIRRAVQRAIDSGDTATVALPRGPNGKPRSVIASPLGRGRGSDGLILVSFGATQAGQVKTQLARADKRATTAAKRDYEGELKSTREELQATVEQYETANEELKAAIEEVTSVNEELQSTNEELEASKEELQSLNEELNTVNAQLERKVTELEEVGDDLRNLLAGTDVATVFLDTHMRIKWFSPAVKTLFDLIDSDIGRPLESFAQRFADRELLAKATAAIDLLKTSETEVVAENGKQFLLRIQPYRMRNNRIGGAVASFFEVTQLKLAQARIAAARDYAEVIVRTIPHPLLVLDGTLRVQRANAAFFKLFDLREKDTLGELVYELGDRQWDIPALRRLLEELLPERSEIRDFEVDHDFPRVGRRVILLNARRLAQESGLPDLILLAIEDITERRNAERHGEVLLGELSHRVKNTLAVVHSLAARALRQSDSLETFRDAFLGRLQALSRAHDTVLEGRLHDVGLGRIVEQALRPFRTSGAIDIADGPALELGSVASQSLTMILHELATNASKYGSLSVPSGQIVVAWRSEASGDASHVVFTWSESGGPAVAEPTREGQGMKFIRGSAAHELRGGASFDFSPGGLRVTLDFPLVMPRSDPGRAFAAGRESG